MTHQATDPWAMPGARLNRRSVDFTPLRSHLTDDDGLLRAPRGMESHYAHMFLDDVQSHLFPVGGQIRETREPIASIVFDSGADARGLERMVTFGFGARDTYDRHRFAAAFVDWARYCVHSLSRRGRVWFELAFIESPAALKPVGFRVMPIYAGEVSRRYRWWGPYAQRVPSQVLRSGNDVTEDSAARSRFSAIELGGPDRIFEVSLPTGLREIHAAALRLAALGEDHIPAFMMPSFAADPAPRVPYDFEAFRRTEQVAVAAATRQIGWYGRGTFNDYQTEYYSMVRRLRFERVLQGLRALMFATANRILDHAGSAIGFRARIMPSGLPTLNDIDEADALLQEGSISARAFLERFSLY